MKASDILKDEPQKPELEGQKKEDYEKFREAINEYNTKVKEYRAEILATVTAQRDEDQVLAIVRDFWGLPRETPAAKTAATGWIKRLQGAFKATFPGREIRPVKNGTGNEITGWLNQDVRNELTESEVSRLVDLSAKYPGLLVTSDRDKLRVIVETAEKNAADIAAKKAARATAMTERAKLQAELTAATAVANQAKAYGDTASGAEKAAKLAASQIAEIDKAFPALEVAGNF